MCAQNTKLDVDRYRARYESQKESHEAVSRWWFETFRVFISGEMMQFDQNFSNGLKPHQLGSVWMDLVGFVWPNSHIVTVLDGNRTKIIDDVSKKSVVPCSLFRNGFTAHFGEFMMSDSKIVGSMAGHHGAAFDLSKSFIDLRCFLKNPRNRGYTQ